MWWSRTSCRRRPLLIKNEKKGKEKELKSIKRGKNVIFILVSKVACDFDPLAVDLMVA